MMEPTETMKLRGRLVVLDEAERSVERLINSRFNKTENCARVSIPLQVDDDDIVASDFLHQLKMSPEELVTWLHPTAHIRSHRGRLWISIRIVGGMKDLSEVMSLGTTSRRRADAWANALDRIKLATQGNHAL